MKTLICLLSDQPVPNLISCRALNPDTILLVETASMKQKNAAKNFQEALKKLKIRADILVFPIPKEKDNHFPTLVKKFQDELLKSFRGTQFCVNLTGGTKPMSIALYEVFRDVPGARFYYTDVSRPREILDFSTGTPAMPECDQLPLEVFLAGYGFEIVTDLSQIEYHEKRALKRAGLSRLLAMHCKNLRMWAQGKSVVDWKQKAMKQPVQIPAGYLVPSPEVAQKIAEYFNLTSQSGSLRGELRPNEVKYLDGGWLEEFVWTTLHPYTRKLQMENLHLNLEIRGNGLEGTKNELDVSFMKNNTFHIMECKTGLQEKMQENNYKIFAVSQQMGALRTQAYLISNSPNVEQVRERANFQKTEIWDADQICALAANPDTELPKLLK